MRRPRMALIAAILGAAPAVSVAIAQQFPSGPPPQTKGADSAVDAMASARSPRALLRNGLDYLEIGEFDRALPLLREAEPRRAELSDKERKALDQGIIDAQKGLRAAANAPGRPTGRGKSTRRPGAMALANPNAAAPRAFGADPIQLTSATMVEPPPAALVLSPTPQPPASQPPEPQPAAPPSPSQGPSNVQPVFGLPPARDPATISPIIEEPAETAPPAAPEPIRDLTTTPPEPASSPPVVASPPSPAAIQPIPTPTVSAPLPSTTPVSEPYPTPSPVGLPEPRAVRPYQVQAAEPTRATRARALAEPSTIPASAIMPIADAPAVEPAQAPAIEPAPPPAAESMPRPEPAPAPIPSPAEPSPTAPSPAEPASEPLPPLPGEVPAPAAANPRMPISSRLSPEVQREVERIAQRQDTLVRREPRQQPGMIPPATAGDQATGPDLSGSRLELPRAPSPTEARAIRPIPVPEEFVPLPPRQWVPTRKFWTAPATCHMPLYFQNAVLERYGQSAEQTLGPVGRYFSYPLDDPRESKQRNYILAPIAGAALFATQVAALPVNMVLDPPWEAEWDLGYYRPGDRIPPDTTYFPQWGVGPPFVGRRY